MGERLNRQIDIIRSIFKVHGRDQTPNAMRYIRHAWFQNPKKKGRWEKLNLILRRDISSGECKYSVSNEKHTVKKKRLAQMQCERYWVERSFQDAKDSIGR